jgi:hypothetical protein
MKNIIKDSNSLKGKIAISFAFISFFFISFLAKYLSEFSHEYLGHCLFSILTGGGYTAYYVSWIWPYEFGWANTFSSSFTSEILIISGGIIVCLLISLLINTLFYFIIKQESLKKIIIAIPVHFLFWVSFWAFVNSIGYLLIGGLINFGDIRILSTITGIKNWIFIFPGIIFFLILFYLISNNFYTIFKPLLSIKAENLVSLFWLLIPVIYVLFYLNPQINLDLLFLFTGLVIMFLPSIFTYFTLRKKNSIWTKIYSIDKNQLRNFDE